MIDRAFYKCKEKKTLVLLVELVAIKRDDITDIQRRFKNFHKIFNNMIDLFRIF